MFPLLISNAINEKRYFRKGGDFVAILLRLLSYQL
jgi:hypothetical protein